MGIAYLFFSLFRRGDHAMTNKWPHVVKGKRGFDEVELTWTTVPFHFSSQSPVQSFAVIGKVVNFPLVCKYPQAVPIGLVLKPWNVPSVPMVQPLQPINNWWTSQSICPFNTIPIKTFQKSFSFFFSFLFSWNFFPPSGERMKEDPSLESKKLLYLNMKKQLQV